MERLLGRGVLAFDCVRPPLFFEHGDCESSLVIVSWIVV